METITTNYHSRELLHFYEINRAKDQEMIKKDYGSDIGDDELFFKYKNYFYRLSDFVIFESPYNNYWEGHLGMSYFDALYIKIVKNNDVIVGYATW
jgi:hypothetical protein